MERFNSIYPFTTENISGYMSDLDLTNKKVVTVTGSTDHIINAILKGAREIITFDVNPLTEKYMDLKLSAITKLSYEDFLEILLYDTERSLDYDIISSLNMPVESKEFFLKQLSFYNNGVDLKKSQLFNRKYFNPSSKLWQNMYLSKENYEIVKEKIKNTSIRFINKSLKDLNLEEEYDYMFLSNISDYINLMFDDDYLVNYKNLLFDFLKNVSKIYFAYLYDVGANNPRSDIDDLDKVREVFEGVEIKTFKSALENEENKKDGVLILRRN